MSQKSLKVIQFHENIVVITRPRNDDDDDITEYVINIKHKISSQYHTRLRTLL